MDRRQNVSDACDRIEPNADVIFSLADDFVWASWPGTDFKGPTRSMRRRHRDDARLPRAM